MTAAALERGRAVPETLAPGAGRPLPVEIAFLAAHGVPLVLLQYGASIARRQGADADAVLIAERLVPEETFYRALAAELKVGYLDPPHALEPSFDLAADAARGYARLAQHPQGLQWLMAPRGAQIAPLMGLARRTNGRPLFALTSPSLFEEALRDASAARLARDAAHAVERAAPELAVKPALRGDALAESLLAGCVLPAALASPFGEISCAMAIAIAAMFLANVALRMFACVVAFRETPPANDLADEDLPIYSIIVALYKEARVARQLSAAIGALDYPRAKLDVKFVVECDDLDTAEALRAARTGAPFEIIVAPPGDPRTKPRALNAAMPFVRGSLLCVFDAEDLPEPDQLRKSAAAFAHADRRIACFQASLCIHNSGRNWKTALFAIDYANLFQVFNRAVAATGLPFFLGGSSNHFRVEALRAVGCWDAFNVTEDADLGLRLARRGYQTRMLQSKTYEEAPDAFPALVRQRSRWFKGWMQTALVHCRDLPWFVADLGARRAIAVIAMFVGGFVGPLLAPFFAVVLFYQAAFGHLLRPTSSGEFMLSCLWCSLALSGAVATVWSRILAMRRENILALWPALLFSPLWTLMLSLAAWRALRDLWARPFHWDKTEHGALAPTVATGAARVRRTAIA